MEEQRHAMADNAPRISRHSKNFKMPKVTEQNVLNYLNMRGYLSNLDVSTCDETTSRYFGPPFLMPNYG